MPDTTYSGVAVLLAGDVRRAEQIKREWADQLPDIAGAHIWTSKMSAKDGLRVGRIYLAQGDDFSVFTETGRRVLAVAVRCALKIRDWDGQVWELTADGEVRALPYRSRDRSGGL